jgi:hypothetical protein
MMKRKTALGRLETATRASDNAMASLGVLSLLVAHLTKGGVFDLPGFRADIARLAAVYRKQGLKGRARIYDELNGVIADVATVRLTTGLEAAVSSLAAKSPKAKMKKKLAVAALVVAIGMAPSAFAQNVVLQSGTMTSGHAPMYAIGGARALRKTQTPPPGKVVAVPIRAPAPSTAGRNAGAPRATPPDRRYDPERYLIAPAK